MHPFRRLAVWRKAHELALRVYEGTTGISERRFPGLTGQLRRAASSIAATIVEGAGRDTPAQFARFLECAAASARELDYHLLLAADLGAIDRSEQVRLNARVDELSRMLVALRKVVRARTGRTPSSPPPRRRRLASGA
jgi:four helix bundle protein